MLQSSVATSSGNIEVSLKCRGTHWASMTSVFIQLVVLCPYIARILKTFSPSKSNVVSSFPQVSFSLNYMEFCLFWRVLVVLFTFALTCVLHWLVTPFLCGLQAAPVTGPDIEVGGSPEEVVMQRAQPTQAKFKGFDLIVLPK